MFELRTGIAGLALTSIACTSIACTGAMADGFARGSIKDAPPAPFSWTGVYFGVNAGYAWGDSKIASSFGCPGAATPPFADCGYRAGNGSDANFAPFSAGASGSPGADGFVGGVQAGYNWQSSNIVLGAEVDFNSFSLKGSVGAGGAIPFVYAGTYSTSAQVSTDWLFTARARLGLAVAPNLMVFATGGLALTDLEVGNAFADDVPPVTVGSSTRSVIHAGWTAGGGVEWALSSNWTAKAEYLYVDFGTVSANSILNTAGILPNTLGTSADLTAHIARAGINYKF